MAISFGILSSRFPSTEEAMQAIVPVQSRVKYVLRRRRLSMTAASSRISRSRRRANGTTKEVHEHVVSCRGFKHT